MPNLTPPKYIYQGSPMLSIEQATEVKAWAIHQCESMSVVQRVLIEIGLAALSSGRMPDGWREGSPTVTQVREAKREMQRYALAQLERRRQSSRNTAANRRRAEAAEALSEA